MVSGKLDKVVLSSDGVRENVPRTNEWRGNDTIYDPWLRISQHDLKIESQNLIDLYGTNRDKAAKIINKGGLNHINRVFFENFQGKSKEKLNDLYEFITKNCAERVLILFYQAHGHRMVELKEFEKCKEYLMKSVDLAKAMPHSSWDKWVVSGYFFLARYSDNQIEKEKYCIKCLLEPRTLDFSSHLKLWKIFRAAAWLVANSESSLAKKAIDKFKQLKFDGYVEYVGGAPVHRWDITDFINDKRKCQKQFQDHTDRLNGNP